FPSFPQLSLFLSFSLSLRSFTAGLNIPLELIFKLLPLSLYLSLPSLSLSFLSSSFSLSIFLPISSSISSIPHSHHPTPPPTSCKHTAGCGALGEERACVDAGGWGGVNTVPLSTTQQGV